ncbi:hypothetical protein [Halobacterium bonnevillei]|uniref:Uncharacterized protein n=1 Tax=Halobacterium bonnevillei TaxID=2692200 RepID=A0A6B0SK11_9EURY|nr:hypothetical protein [Halobacterium bonnevillei]MXR22144.1 hypothetical protein [Halobacterium bonnevillei]
MLDNSKIREIAPHLDKYDLGFGASLLLVLVAAFAPFIQGLSLPGIVAAWSGFVESSGTIALISAWTAFIALYRLRHRPNKTRPAVREDFEREEGEEKFDFGLRNYGPGPALYFQAVATVEKGGSVETVSRFVPHDEPIHLNDGEFISLVDGMGEEGLIEIQEKYGNATGDEDSPAMLKLYYSYVSQSGVREPTDVFANRDDDNILSELKQTDNGVRRIELSRLVDNCLT